MQTCTGANGRNQRRNVSNPAGVLGKTWVLDLPSTQAAASNLALAMSTPMGVTVDEEIDRLSYRLHCEALKRMVHPAPLARFSLMHPGCRPRRTSDTVRTQRRVGTPGDDLRSRLKGLRLGTSCPVSGPMISREFRLMRVRAELRYKVGGRNEPQHFMVRN